MTLDMPQKKPRSCDHAHRARQLLGVDEVPARSEAPAYTPEDPLGERNQGALLATELAGAWA